MAHTKTATVTLWQDRRRAKKDGTFPVKMQVFFDGKRKHYSTGISLTKEDFNKAWHKLKPDGTLMKGEPKGKLKEVREKLEGIIDNAEDVVNSLKEFNFKGFEAIFFGTKGAEGHDVFSYYRNKINEFSGRNQHGSTDQYTNSLKAIKRYLQYNSKNGKEPSRLEFDEVDLKFLKNFNHYMQNIEGRRPNTVNTYLRPLKTIMYDAIEDGETRNFPFNRRKFKMPKGQSLSESLTFEQLRLLQNATCNTTQQQRAKDWWLLSYYLGGANLVDLVKLRNKDIKWDAEEKEYYAVFWRQKNEGENFKEFEVPLIEPALEIIEKYRNKSINLDSLIFDVINKNDSSSEKRRKTKKFGRSINQNLQKLSKEIQLLSQNEEKSVRDAENKRISFQWARHTCNTLAGRKGYTREMRADIQGHDYANTSKNYDHGVTRKGKREILTAIA